MLFLIKFIFQKTKTNMKRIIFAVLFVFIFLNSLLLSADLFNDVKPDDDLEYIIRLKNGDIITGIITEFVQDATEGEGIKVKTEIGKAIFYANQIAEINIKEENYRHDHRIFLLPTANPIGKNLFAGAFEMLLLYVGFGISDIVSITAGQSLVPTLSMRQQLNFINVKATFLKMEFDSIARQVTLAVGGNLGFVNHNNKLIHLYTVATVKLLKTYLTGSVFYKAGAEDFYFVSLGNYLQDFRYANGAFGIGLGIDTEISQRHDIHLIGELWNSDVAKPTNTAFMLGFRICNTAVSADFGFAFFTQPYLVPFTSFVWTPF
jgi:hypothetical protein